MSEPESAIFIGQLRILSAISELSLSRAVLDSEGSDVIAKHTDDCKFWERMAEELEKMAVATDSGEEEFRFKTISLYVNHPTTPTT